MNKIYCLLLLFGIPLFGETIKFKFVTSWHPKIAGLNRCHVNIVSSKPLVMGLRKSDGSTDYHEVKFAFTPFAEHYENILKMENPLTKRSFKSLEFIVSEFIGLKSVNFNEDKMMDMFGLEMLSWKIEKEFIKNDYSVTCKIIERKDEHDHQELKIEIFFTKN